MKKEIQTTELPPIDLSKRYRPVAIAAVRAACTVVLSKRSTDTSKEDRVAYSYQKASPIDRGAETS